MKNLLIGLTFLTSMSAFATDQCDGNDGAVKMVWQTGKCIEAYNSDMHLGNASMHRAISYEQSRAFLKCVENKYQIKKKSITTSSADVITAIAGVIQSGSGCEVGATLDSLITLISKD